ncbi:MAG: A/G-specific adenine glycosylase [Betaproteobacteria bacterium]
MAGGQAHAGDVDAPPFATRLIAWQRCHGRHDLPWQNTVDAYRIWLSEIMLQQTQVAAVIPYYERFLRTFPELLSLAAATLEQVLELWSGLGYYGRARNLHRCAQQVRDEFGGDFPRDVATLAKLPGIGRSTAAAIAALAFGVRAPILDGNVKRVLARHAGVEGFPGLRAVELQLWREAEARMPAAQAEQLPASFDDAGSSPSPGHDATTIVAYTQAMMDLGATLCTRAGPQCHRCPVAVDCVAFGTGRQASLPAPRPQKVLPQRTVTMLLLQMHEAVLLERRPAAGIWGGLWSLPEIPAGNSAESYCATRFAADVEPGTPLGVIRHGFTHFHLTITPQPCVVLNWPRRAEEPGLLWLPLMDVNGAALPAPIKKLLATLSRPTLFTAAAAP